MISAMIGVIESKFTDGFPVRGVIFGVIYDSG